MPWDSHLGACPPTALEGAAPLWQGSNTPRGITVPFHRWANRGSGHPARELELEASRWLDLRVAVLS